MTQQGTPKFISSISMAIGTTGQLLKLLASRRSRILVFPNGDTLDANLITGVRDQRTISSSRVIAIRTNEDYWHAEGSDAELDAFLIRARDCHRNPYAEEKQP